VVDRFEHRPAWSDDQAAAWRRRRARLSRSPSLALTAAPARRDADRPSTAPCTGYDPRVTPRIPLILDVDTGIDDAMALLYTAASPEAEIVAVTCVGGNVDARQVERNTRAVLELAGRTDVEVALGREQPLVRPVETTPETHGPQGLGYAELPEPTRPLSERHAADLFIEEARTRPGEITLVTLGPLTNLAVALLREPRLPQLLKGWVLMGGAYRHPGNTAPTTEWNIHCDPEAAKIAIGAWASSAHANGHGLPIALGLDVTERAKITPDRVVALARAAGSEPDDSIALERGEDPMHATRSVASNPIVRFVADALRYYMEFHSRYDGFYGAFIHDPLATAAALDPSLATTEAVPVDVELGGTLTTGETVTDWRRVWGRPATLEVAVDADAERFLDTFVERVGRLAADRVNVAR
jgi:purine nucleosidase